VLQNVQKYKQGFALRHFSPAGKPVH